MLFNNSEPTFHEHLSDELDDELYSEVKGVTEASTRLSVNIMCIIEFARDLYYSGERSKARHTIQYMVDRQDDALTKANIKTFLNKYLWHKGELARTEMSRLQSQYSVDANELIDIFKDEFQQVVAADIICTKTPEDIIQPIINRIESELKINQ